jgi:hypothetical protein
MTLEDDLRSQLGQAEWRDKHIYVCDGPTLQHWALTIYLPVPIDAKDKSPEAALQRYIDNLAAPTSVFCKHCYTRGLEDCECGNPTPSTDPWGLRK